MPSRRSAASRRSPKARTLGATSSSSRPAADQLRRRIEVRAVLEAAPRAELVGVLGRARELGFLGPGPVDDHIEHSLAFVKAWSSVRTADPRRMLDLGSGGGVPGLVLALAWPHADVLLLDGSERRSAFLRAAVGALRLAPRVDVLAQRAEDAGRSSLRGTFSLVTARGFAPPAVTAECGAAFLAEEGILAVADPPGGDASRWPGETLASLGMQAVGLLTAPATVQLIELTGTLPERYPRRVGMPAKRPLW